jgi:serine/threonine-protein kinase RsbT
MDEVLGALGQYFPAGIARAVLGSALRRGGRDAESLEERDLSELVSALEQMLPMYIVDPGRRGECIGKVRRLIPGEARGKPPSSPRPVAYAAGIVRVRSARDVVQASDLARESARKLGFSPLDQTKIATVASELARNILLYVGDGEIRINTVQVPRRGIQIMAVDSGAGIPDVGLVMEGGYRSRTGMGMGLKGTKRLMDELDIESRPGAGTTVVARKLLS